MSADLDPRDELTDRLAALGRRPVDPALQSEHLTALAGVRSGSAFRTSLAGRLKVAAGVMAGFLIGATGLTTAGALGPVQGIAATAIEKATPLDGLPESASAKAKAKGLEKAAKNKAKGAEAGEGTGSQKIWSLQDPICPTEGTFKNRGQFLKAAKDGTGGTTLSFAEARKTDCGKGIEAAGEDDDETTETLEEPKAEKPADDVEAGESNGQNGDGNGQSAGKGKADDAGNPAETGKPDDAGKPADTGTKPATVPAAPAQEKADDNANLPAAGEPAAPADAAGDDTDSDV